MLFKEKIIETINSNEFYGLDDVLELLYGQTYKTFKEYIALKSIKDQVFTQTSVQTNSNKLFLQTDSNGLKTYYFYFSYGSLNLIEYIDWNDSLRQIVQDIKNILTQSNIKNIIIAGHSVGSIVSQHLGIELIRNQVNTSKIFIIGSGCRINNVLTKEELTIFKNVYEDRHFFVLTGYIKDNKIYYDSKSKDSVIKINGDLINRLPNNINITIPFQQSQIK